VLAHFVEVINLQGGVRSRDGESTVNLTDEMATAGTKVAQLAFRGNGAQAERKTS